MTRRARESTATTQQGYLGRPALALLLAAAISRALDAARHRKDSQ